jgi:hypothetical protein
MCATQNIGTWFPKNAVDMEIRKVDNASNQYRFAAKGMDCVEVLFNGCNSEWES